jgi:hypothetical protein
VPTEGERCEMRDQDKKEIEEDDWERGRRKEMTW